MEGWRETIRKKLGNGADTSEISPPDAFKVDIEAGPSNNAAFETADVKTIEIKTEPEPKSDVPEFVSQSKPGLNCHVCPYRAREIRHLAKHMLLHEEEVEDPSSVHTCLTCKYKTRSKLLFVKHTRIHALKKQRSCDICNFKCTNRGVLMSHMAELHPNRPLPCSFCDTKALGPSAFIEHTTECHAEGNMLLCNVCHYKTNKRAFFVKHMLIHAEGDADVVFSCHICDYKTNKKDRVDDHIKTHTGEKPYACDFCDYRCIQKCTLVIHMKRHGVNRLFPCSLCDYKGKVQNDVYHHMEQMHRGARAHPDAPEQTILRCGVCPYKCKTESALKHHLVKSMGNNQYACVACNHSYQRQCDLTSHLQLHPEIKLHCPLCSYSTFFKDQYDTHFDEHMN